MHGGLTESHWPADRTADITDITTGDLLRRWAERTPERTALIEVAQPGEPSLTAAPATDRTWTYHELHRAAVRCAHWLLARFEPGERVTVWAPNVPEWVVLQYGAALAGLVLVTANPALREGELAHVVGQSRSAGLFVVDSFRGTRMAEIAARVEGPRHVVSFTGWLAETESAEPVELPVVRPDDPAQIQYTSGTTGSPKGALLRHRGLVNNAAFAARRMRFPGGGTWVSAMPLFHTGGSTLGVLGSASVGGAYALCRVFDADLVLSALERFAGDLVSGVPTMLLGMLDHPGFAERDLSRCAVVVSGGTTVPAALVHRVEAAFGARFVTVYGQTEASSVVTATEPDDEPAHRAETVGRPLPQVEVKVVDRAGKVVPIGAQGEVVLRGYQTMLGYFDLPDERAPDRDGWLHTGDLGTMDEQGYLRITGRARDMIIRGGENVYPREVEDLLCRHESVRDAAVVARPDDTWGEQVAAVLRPADPANPPSPELLDAYCRDHLAAFKVPRFWYAVDEFPLTATGKVQKFRLRELLRTGALPVLSSP
ncbi:AMP-binding protein [Umezawaea beigongshangensis]|uniref:AMP-binding protein n=1 Tax=Umezawaea beigongshangensis TaxID=2780383 RepID=UPI0018F1D851|nr:AMP-binding protein [Umezawaea beigongshangensis]